MKKRIRQLVRKDNWQVVEVSRANLYKFFDNVEEWGNQAHYREIRSWCANTFPKGSWEASYSHSTKKFVFKEDKHAMLFKLKWIS